MKIRRVKISLTQRKKNKGKKSKQRTTRKTRTSKRTRQRGGKITNVTTNATELQAPPMPELYTFPSGVGTARQAAMQRQINDANNQNNMNNHIHQSGGNACMGGTIPIAPTFGVMSGPGHMNPTNQTITNSNTSCQGEANRVYDSQVEMPSSYQSGGKRKTMKYRKSRTRTKRGKHKGKSKYKN